MKIILLQDVKKVGQRGSVITVKDGYAQNVLLPKKIAISATAENLKKWEQGQKKIHAEEALTIESARALMAEIEGKIVEIKARANESGGLFESIHENKITDALKEQLHVSVPADAIKLEEPIKHTGSFPIEISLRGATAHVEVLISKDV